MENQAYISHVHLKGYKSIRDMEVDLLPGLNIIIGPNGSGKTNFLNYLNLTSGLVDNGYRIEYILDDLKLGFSWSIEANNGDSISVDSFVKHNNGLSTIEIDEVYSSYDNIEKELYSYKFDYRRKRLISSSNKNYLSKNQIDFLLKRLIYIKFKNPIDFISSEDSISIMEDIYNFISFAGPFLDSFDDLELHSFGEIIGCLWVTEKITHKDLKTNQMKVKKFIENLKKCTVIEDIRLDINKLEVQIADTYDDDLSHYSLKNIRNSILFKVYNRWIHFNGLSDGTKRLFYLVMEVSYANDLVLIEEPELGIHPDQLHLLMDFLKEQSKEKQIIITTHSPEVMNILNKNELDRIIVTRYDNEKGTQMHKLSPHQIRKGQIYMKEVGHLSDYWVHSNLEEYEVEEEN